GNNAPGNAFPNGWTVKLETEVRHPLLQGSGMRFNRIAGPNQTPGLYEGVLIARLNADVQLTEFEASVRDLVSNLENAYWDLYFAYRDLDAKIAARDTALDTWRRIQALYESGRRGGEAEKEAQAREQYFRFKEEVENALSGRRVDGTRTGNGSLAGTFRASGGVLVAERRLRRLMNLPASDGELLRPVSEPTVAEVVFDWDRVMRDAAHRRVELRRQKWSIRRRELELIASKNHLLPRLDAVGRYRWRGFGRDLIDANGAPIPRFETAYDDLLTGDFQEWQLGVELSIPIGYRRAHAAVRNAELRLARERAVLCDQQQEVIHDAAGAVAELDRAYVTYQTGYNRLVATSQQLAAVKAAFEADKAPLDLLLDAQRRLAEAESRHFRSLAEYAVAIKNVHFAKGTLLEFDGVYLAEGAWPGKAYADAADLESRRGRPKPFNYASSRAPVVSRGVYEQHREPGGVVAFGQTAPQPTPAGAKPSAPAEDTTVPEQLAPPPSPTPPTASSVTPRIASEASTGDKILRLPSVVDGAAAAGGPGRLEQPIFR
ncbi:MAG: TolC family protein, partial [Planctomycetota bacterium]